MTQKQKFYLTGATTAGAVTVMAIIVPALIFKPIGLLILAGMGAKTAYHYFKSTKEEPNKPQEVDLQANQIDMDAYHDNIDTAAGKMATHIRRFYDDHPAVRDSLKEWYGSREQLPTADDFKKQFLDISERYLKTQTGKLKRMLDKEGFQASVSELARSLLNIANETGSYMAMGLKPSHIPIIQKLYGKRLGLEVDLIKAKKLRAEQMLIQAQMEEDQTAKTKALEARRLQFVQAGAKKDTEKQAYVDAYQEYENAKAEAKQAAEKLKQASVDTHVVEANMKKIMITVTKYKAELSNALQFGTIGSSRKAIDELIQKGGKSASDDAALEAIIHDVELQKALGEVEKMDLDQESQKVDVRADMALHELLEAKPETQQTQTAAKKTLNQSK